MDYREPVGTMGVGTTCEPPIETIAERLDQTMGMLKELLIAMDDTSLQLFGTACPPAIEKPPEPKNMADVATCIRAQTRVAMDNFMAIRKKLV